MNLRAIWISGLLAAACGGTDIEGLYMVTSHTLADDCGAAAPVDGQPFFRIIKSDFLGTAFHNPQECETADETTCSSIGFFSLLIEEIDNGYSGESGFSSTGTPGQCSLTYSYSSATLDGDVITFRAEQYGETVTSATCDADEAIARGKEMPCQGIEIVVATRVD